MSFQRNLKIVGGNLETYDFLKIVHRKNSAILLRDFTFLCDLLKIPSKLLSRCQFRSDSYGRSCGFIANFFRVLADFCRLFTDNRRFLSGSMTFISGYCEFLLDS